MEWIITLETLIIKRQGWEAKFCINTFIIIIIIIIIIVIIIIRI